MNKKRFALIGCGSIAKKHVEALRLLPDSTELVAVCDQNEERARSMGETYGVPGYVNYAEMIEAANPDVLIVLTPSGDHAARILDLVRFRKHIVVEKPLALRLDDADRVIRACADAGIMLFVVKQNRYNRPIQAVRQALDAGRFGRLVLGTVRVRWCRTQQYYDGAPWRGTWAWDGGVLCNQASHHIDMLEWLMGPVESVSAMTSTALVNIEAEDTGVAVLRFRSGALGVIEATTATRPKDLEGSVSILGEKGSAVVGGFAMDKLVTWQFQDPTSDDATMFETHGENPKQFAWNHAEYMAGVIEALNGRSKALVDGIEGRKALELINAIYESAETDRTVPISFRPRVSKLGYGAAERRGASQREDHGSDPRAGAVAFLKLGQESKKSPVPLAARPALVPQRPSVNPAIKP